MEELKQLVEDFIEYTRTWSISDTEWYWNIEGVRKSDTFKRDASGDLVREKHITNEEFERAIREEILYEFIYNINGIKFQMENDLCYGYDEEQFNKISIDMEKKIQKLFKDFKIDRS